MTSATRSARVRLLAASALVVASAPLALLAAPANADDAAAADTPPADTTPPPAEPTPQPAPEPEAGPVTDPAPVEDDGTSTPPSTPKADAPRGTPVVATGRALQDPDVTISGPDQATYGETVTFTATVTGDTDPQPTGKVTFTNAGISIGCESVPLNANGKARCTTEMRYGGYVLASYSGDTRYRTGSSGKIVTVVAGTTTTLAIDPEGQLDPGATPTLTATVSSMPLPARYARGVPGFPPAFGHVTFTQNGAVIAGCDEVEIDAAGQATCAVPALAQGRYRFVATYGGGSESYGPSAARLGVQVGDDPAPTPTPTPTPSDDDVTPAVSTTSTTSTTSTPGVLPSVGNDVDVRLLGLGGAAVLGGLGLLVASRRRDENLD